MSKWKVVYTEQAERDLRSIFEYCFLAGAAKGIYGYNEEEIDSYGILYSGIVTVV